jgi:hypothetical protein
MAIFHFWSIGIHAERFTKLGLHLFLLLSLFAAV